MLCDFDTDRDRRKKIIFFYVCDLEDWYKFVIFLWSVNPP